MINIFFKKKDEDEQVRSLHFLSYHHSEEGHGEKELLLFPGGLQCLVTGQLLCSCSLCSVVCTSGLEAAAPALASSQPGRKGKEGVEEVL